MTWQGIKSVGIVGAGVAGLAVAKTLAAQGLDCRLFERRPALGGVWADGYANFGVQVQKELYEFPDWPLPADTPHFTPGPIFQSYLEAYADNFGLTPHIRLETTVAAIEPRGDGAEGWTFVLRDRDGERREDFDLALICVGLYSNRPHIPDFAGREDFTGELLHNSDLKAGEQLRGKRVAVIGYGKSATDAALEAAAHAEEAHLVFREPHWPVPRKLAGVLPFKWGMLSRMTSTLIPLYQRPSAVERAVHGLGRPLVWLWWRIVELLLTVQHRLDTRTAEGANLRPTKPVEHDCFGEAGMVPRPALYRLLRQGRIIGHRSAVAALTANGITLENGAALEVDCLLLATGWRSDYSLLPEAAQALLGGGDDGFYLYRHILHPDLPRLAFIGRASTFTSVLTYCLQSRWLAELIAGMQALPSEAAMRAEIEEMKAWKRGFMPFSQARGARLLLHMLHYHDELLGDFGANPLRKRGLWAPLKELIEPYQPADYRAIVSGDWERLEGRLAGP